MGNTFSNLNQRNSLKQVPPSVGVGTGSLPQTGGRLRLRSSPHRRVAISGSMTLATILLLWLSKSDDRLTRQLRDLADLR
jgi:hypothetical protein